jgi:hypothetical protein
MPWRRVVGPAERDPTDPGPDALTIDRRAVLRFLVVVAVGLFLLHYAVMYLRFVHGREYLFGFAGFGNVDEEESLATYVQSLQLLAAAVLLFAIGRRARRTGAAHAVGWLALAAIFLYLSLDEATLLHERLILPLQRAFDASGPFFFAWVLVAIPLVAVFALLYVPFLRDLEPRTRNGFLLAGFLYLCGTLGMEMVGGVWADDRSFIDPVYLNVIVPIEEAFEVAGQLVFLSALLAYAARAQPIGTIRFVDRVPSLRAGASAAGLP